MAFVGMNPYTNLNAFVGKRPEISFPQEVVNNIKLVTIFPDGNPKVEGSYIFRIQRYPADVDLGETITESTSVDTLIDEFIVALKRTVKNILRAPEHYISDFKAGTNPEYANFDAGNLTNGIWYLDRHKLYGQIKDAYHYGLFNSDEAAQLVKLTMTEGDDENRYDLLKEIIREKKTLRWTTKEIDNGYQRIVRETGTSHVIYLRDALKQRGIVKMDILCKSAGRFIEITNFVTLNVIINDGIIEPINMPERDLMVEIPKEVEKLYYSDMYYSPFKMIKRLFSLYRMRNRPEIIDKIAGIISSDVSLLYQIKSEIDTIIQLFGITKVPPMKSINHELDEMKIRIATIIQLSDAEIIEICDAINKAIKVTTAQMKEDALELVLPILKRKINFLTINYLNQIGWNPPPQEFLPPVATYNRSKVRTPNENP